MLTLLALAPILVIVGLMALLRWSAVTAGLVGLTVAAIVAPLAFGYGTQPDSAGAAAIGVAAEALFVTATILWIIFPALCTYELQSRGGAFATLTSAIRGVAVDRPTQAVLVAWFFALFLEGAAGFGTPVALAAPLLVSLGFSPVAAVALVLVGHAVGVSFGAVGTPVLTQAAMTGFGGAQLAAPTGLLHAAVGLLLLIFLVRLVARDPEGTGTGGIGMVAAAAACFLLPYLAIALWIGPELPTLGGALIGGVAFATLMRRRAKDQARQTEPRKGLWRALLPYTVIVALILLSRLVPPLQAALAAIELRWSLPGGFGGAMQPLYHPGTLLLLGFLAGGLMQGRAPADLAAAALGAARRLPAALLALMVMLTLARLMMHSGMIAALAEGAAATFGPAWPWMAPAVGALGTFVTGSATASNVLFADFQHAAAASLGLPALWLLAAQGFGAAIGNMICPHNIIAGGATVGLSGKEGEVLRRTLLPCALATLAGGAAVWVAILATS